MSAHYYFILVVRCSCSCQLSYRTFHEHCSRQLHLSNRCAKSVLIAISTHHISVAITISAFGQINRKGARRKYQTNKTKLTKSDNCILIVIGFIFHYGRHPMKLYTGLGGGGGAIPPMDKTPGGGGRFAGGGRGIPGGGGGGGTPGLRPSILKLNCRKNWRASLL